MNKIKNRIKSNAALMGTTHVASAISVFFFMVAMFPEFIYGQLGTEDIFIVIASLIIVGGATLLPDLDNTKSSAISSLGIVGVGLSKAMRAFAVVVYQISRTRYDDDNANPHRRFWHTLVSVILLFLAVFASVSIKTKILIFNNEYTVGFLFACMWLFVCSRLFLTTFFKKSNDRFKRQGMTGSFISLIISILITVGLVLFTEHSESYRWIAFSMSAGYLIHILGDTLTTSGTPLLWPIKIKGKRWYDVRLFKIKAGGDVEKYIFLPGFILLTVVSLAKIIARMLGS